MSARDLALVTRAADFAARAHTAQHRKGLAKEPYVNHLTEVAALLAEADRRRRSGADCGCLSA